MPDFLRKDGAIETVVAARPDVLNHNLETVPRLYAEVRPGRALFPLAAPARPGQEASTRRCSPNPASWSGSARTRGEVLQVMDDLRAAEVDFLTIGQYLQPTPKHHPVDRFVHAGGVRRLSPAGAGQGLPDGLGVAVDPLVLPCRRRFRPAAGGPRRRRSRLTHSARCRRMPSSGSCPTRRSSCSSWWRMSSAIRNSCRGASARGCASATAT